MEPAVTPGTDRRAAPRRRRVEEHGIVSTHIRPGYSAHLVDVSSGGALLDTPFRMLPGTSVDIRLATRREPHVNVRGEVVRCTVVRLRPLTYRGAVRFDRELTALGKASGYPLHTFDGGATVQREEATHDVV